MCGKRVMVAHFGCVLGLMRGMTIHLLKVLILKRDMSRQTGCFQYTKSSQNLGMILKRGMTIHLQKGLIQKRVMAPFIGNVLGLMRVMCGRETLLEAPESTISWLRIETLKSSLNLLLWIIISFHTFQV